jgi:glycosyltransferase involved in cell wall biosynthesis
MTKVSICIPAYKQVQFLRVTLESILSQRFTDYEVNITDDSPDDSVEQLVKEFLLDGRIRYSHNPKQLGSPENWNECIRSARGELIKIMHHDDHFTDADSLGRFVDMLQKPILHFQLRA